jgi:hypothetical protein
MDLAGPREWTYVTDAEYLHALFLIHHGDDDLPERYDAIGGNTATFVFGDDRLSRVARRFSLGFIASTNYSTVYDRVAFVTDAID